MSTEPDGLYQVGNLQKASALFIPSLATFPVMVMPFIFGAVIDQLAIDSSTATYATSAEIAMIAFASLLVSVTLKILPPKATAVVGVLMVVIGQLLSIHGDSLDSMLTARALTGFGEGLCLGIGFATLAQIKGGTNLIAYASGVSAAFGLLSFVIVPQLQPVLGTPAIFWFMVAVAGACLPLTLWMPNVKLKKLPITVDITALFNARSFSLFTVSFMASCGSNTLWLYFEQVGQSVGMTLEDIGHLGVISSIPTLLVPFVANFVFSKNKSVLPIGIVCLLSGVASYYYGDSSTSWMFSAVIFAMSFLYIFLLAYVRMFSAHMDATGRTTAAVGGADSLGLVIGPLVAAFTLNLTNSFEPLSFFGLAIQGACIIPCILFIAVSASKKSASAKAY